MRFILKKLDLKSILIIVLLVAVAILVLTVSKPFGNSTETLQETTKLKFESIGELATQASYSTEIGEIKDSRTFYGYEIPLTKSTLIYSYDFVIKAGFDFSKIEWKEENKKIIVNMPEPKVLSNNIKLDSLKVFIEDESVFNNLSEVKKNANTAAMQKDTEKTAIDNGLFDYAKENAENIIKGFFSSYFDFGNDAEDYKIEFIYKDEKKDKKE